MGNKNVQIVGFFSNGNTMAFDEAGEQVSEAQVSWFRLWVEQMKEKGIDLSECIFQMPDGRFVKIHPLEDGDWNCLKWFL